MRLRLVMIQAPVLTSRRPKKHTKPHSAGLTVEYGKRVEEAESIVSGFSP